MRAKLIILIALIGLTTLPALAESPYVFGWHFWRDGANIDSAGGGGAGRPGWVTELDYSTNFQPDMDKFRRIADEGHTIIMRVDWDASHTFPPNAADYWVMAARYAFWAYKLKDYCHIYLIGNEEWCNYNCFREVRKAIHAVQPHAIFCPGAPSDIPGTMATLGDYCDGMTAHTTTTSWIGSLDTAYPSGKTKLCYITEFHGAPPNNYNQFRIDYAGFANWNATHEHKLECATNFVYYEYGSEYTSTQMQPMQNADYCEAAAYSYTNSYAQPYIAITNISVTGTGESTSQISWNTDVGATGQVEYWEDREIGQHWSAFNGTYTTSHTASIGPLIPGRTYHYIIKSYRGGRPLTLSQVQTFVHQPPNSGTIEGYVKTHAGAPVHNATVTRSPGGYSFTTDENGKFVIAGCPAGTYSLSVSSNTTNSVTRSSIDVSAGQTTSVDIRVTPKINYLQNAGFESNMTGWTTYGDAPDILSGKWFGDITAHSGSKFMGRAANWGMPKGGIYQRVTGLPAGAYQFSTFARMYVLDHPYNETKQRVGIDPTGGTDADSPNVRWSDWDYNFWLGESKWIQLTSPTVNVTGGACTVFVQYDDTCMQGWHIHSFDDAVLSASALQVQSAANPTAAKAYEDGAPVTMSGVIATTDKGALGTDIIYVEDPDRTGGIKVDMTGIATTVVEGNTISVTGVMATDANGERYIDATSVTATPGTALEPLGLTQKSIGGADAGYEPGPPTAGQQGVVGGIGVNNVGLLVRTTGKVIETTGSYVVISDGSPEPIKVDISRLSETPSGNVIVAGIVSVEKSGDQLKAVLRPRKNADVVNVD